MNIQHFIPLNLINFLLVISFSLLIGLEQRRLHIQEEIEKLFGTDRTFTLIGILGYVLYILQPQSLILFMGGGLALTFLLGVYYFWRIKISSKMGMTSLVLALITYCLAPLTYTQPAWLVLLLVVSILILTEIKGTLLAFSKKFDDREFLTLAKFLILAGVILPLLPDHPISATLNISPFRFWLAIVVICGISYLAYLTQKFIFPKAGLILTGILGGLYSSTATSVILARKSREGDSPDNKMVAAILSATTMMYLRIFLVAWIFNQKVAWGLLPYFAILLGVSVVTSLVFWRMDSSAPSTGPPSQVSFDRNPLEFKISLIFGVLFVFFALLTGFVIKHFGGQGIRSLSLMVGVTDIDPFIINLLQGNWHLPNALIILAIVNATTSNNIIKLIYAYMLGHPKLRIRIAIGFSFLIATGLILAFLAPAG
ncbi:MAG: MgtC/SapB family protein [Chitinophagaceae bacterium]